MKLSTVYALVIGLGLVIPLVGDAGLDNAPAEPMPIEVPAEVEMPAQEGVEGAESDLLSPETLVPRATPGRCNCNVATGIGLCAQGTTCQACPCLSTQGSFFDGRC